MFSVKFFSYIYKRNFYSKHCMNFLVWTHEDSPETLRKPWVSAKFLHKEIRWKFLYFTQRKYKITLCCVFAVPPLLLLPNRNTTSFHRPYNVYTTSPTSHRCLIDVETTSCVCWWMVNLQWMIRNTQHYSKFLNASPEEHKESSVYIKLLLGHMQLKVCSQSPNLGQT